MSSWAWRLCSITLLRLYNGQATDNFLQIPNLLPLEDLCQYQDLLSIHGVQTLSASLSRNPLIVVQLLFPGYTRALNLHRHIIQRFLADQGSRTSDRIHPSRSHRCCMRNRISRRSRSSYSLVSPAMHPFFTAPTWAVVVVEVLLRV